MEKCQFFLDISVLCCQELIKILKITYVKNTEDLHYEEI